MTLLATLPLGPFASPLTILVPLLLGIAFGFTLESSGFGDSRRLAAQFYFKDLRVLKVMFTAIITCMVLLAWCVALGWMDFDRIFVNPTYLASGILGGLLLGFGFIIGGYCPGTSLTSAATLKIDGILFVLGVCLGAFVFGETADAFRPFYDNAGALGRLTLPDWLGVPPAFVVLGVVLMALGMFWGAELLEKRFGPGKATEVEPGAPRRSLVVAAFRGGGVALAALLVLAAALPAVGTPTLDDRIAEQAPETSQLLVGRKVQIDPLEMLGLMHRHVQGKLSRLQLEILDVRDESDFNLFHLKDARRVSLEELRGERGRAYAGEAYDQAIKVVVSNDTERASEGWVILKAQGVKDVYVLSGGMNLWLDVFSRGRLGAGPKPAAMADESLRHPFSIALGDRYRESKPPLPVYQHLIESKVRPVPWKVKPVVASPEPSGGCG